MTTTNFQKMLDYDLWANQRTIQSIQSAASRDEALRLMGHILGAQRVWIERFGSVPSQPAEVWPNLTIEQCRASLPDLHAAWKDLLSGMSPQALAGEMTYRNSKGTEFTNRVADVLTHLVNHGTYHRGQVAAAVRRAGGQPAATDYIVYARQLAPGA